MTNMVASLTTCFKLPTATKLLGNLTSGRYRSFMWVELMTFVNCLPWTCGRTDRFVRNGQIRPWALGMTMYRRGARLGTHDLLPDPHPDLAVKLFRPTGHVLGYDLCERGSERSGADDGDLVSTRGELRFRECGLDGRGRAGDVCTGGVEQDDTTQTRPKSTKPRSIS